MEQVVLGCVVLATGLGATERACAANETGPPAATSTLAPAAPAFDEPEDPDDPSVVRRKPLGLMFDLGSMHGGMLSLLYRPAPWLRLHAGAGTNAVSAGYRAGFSLARSGGGPSLNVEGGHFFPGDINGVLKILVGTGYRANPRLEHFDYDFVNLHAGWDVEAGHLIFFARGGVSVLWTQIPAPPRVEAGELITDTGIEPFRLVLPSVSLGFIGFL